MQHRPVGVRTGVLPRDSPCPQAITPEASAHVPKGFVLAAIGRRETEACNHASGADQQMTMKAIVGLLLCCTVTISGNALETAATWGTREATPRDRNVINQMH